MLRLSDLYFNGLCKKVSRSMASHTKKYVDVIISGGGMVGTALACALGKTETFADRKILLLEANKKTDKKDWKSAPYENRVSAITPGSRAFFEDIGLWNQIAKRRFNQFTDMYVWDGNSAISFDSLEIGMESMAYMIENSVIVESCVECASELENVDIQYETKVQDVYRARTNHENVYTEDLVEVSLQNGETIATKLLIGADGTESFVRKKANLKTYEYDYGQSAVVATLNVEQGERNSTAWQKYLTTGPIALLPMSDTVSSLVWSTTHEIARRLVKLPEEEFVNELNKAYQSVEGNNMLIDNANSFVQSAISLLRPGAAAAVSFARPPKVIECQPKSRGMFPLKLNHATQYVNSRIALIGDAAHRIHPMAGQGVNLGFGDAKCLVENIDVSIRKGKDYETDCIVCNEMKMIECYLKGMVDGVSLCEKFYMY